MKRRVKKLSVPMTPRETWMGWCYLPVQLLLLPGLLTELFVACFPAAGGAWLNFVYYLINFTAVILIFHTFLKKSLETAGENFWRLLQAVLLGFVCYYGASLLLAGLIQRLQPGFSNVNDGTIARLSREGYYLMAVGTVVLVPPAEECLYRGVVFRWLYARSRWVAYVLSTLLFCAIHVMGYVGSYDAGTLALCFLQYIPAGVCLAWAYETADTIFAPILIHAAINAVGFCAMR